VQLEEQLDSGTLERLEKQSRLLQRIYQADLAKSPTSRAAGTSRSKYDRASSYDWADVRRKRVEAWELGWTRL